MLKRANKGLRQLNLFFNERTPGVFHSMELPEYGDETNWKIKFLDFWLVDRWFVRLGPYLLCVLQLTPHEMPDGVRHSKL